MQVARELSINLDFLAARITARHFERFPQLAERYGEYGRRRCLEDTAFHLSFLAAAADANLESIFFDYVSWAKTVLVSRGVSADDLLEHLRTTSSLLTPDVAGRNAPELKAIVNNAIAQLPEMPVDVPSFIDSSTDVGRVAGNYLKHLIAGDEKSANRAIAGGFDAGLNVIDLCSGVFDMVQQEVGRLWQLNKISVATEHYCTAVAQRTLAHVCGSRAVAVTERRRRVLAMCAPGEQHDLGLRALTDLLALEGWDSYFLGANVPASAAARMCADRKIDVLLISASLPPRIAAVTEVVSLVRALPGTANMRIYVGGRAFNRNPEVWRVTGADGFAPNGSAALHLLRSS